MFITKKHIPRRTILRGAGAALALPFLEAMVPARTALAQTAAAPKQRFVGLFVPHGAGPGHWIPQTTGKLGNELPLIWKAFEPNLKDDLVIVSGLHARSAEPPPGVTGADHWVAAAFMCVRQAEEDRRRGRAGGHDDRPDHRPEDRRRQPAAVAADGRRGSGLELEQLR